MSGAFSYFHTLSLQKKVGKMKGDWRWILAVLALTVVINVRESYSFSVSGLDFSKLVD